MKYNDLTLGKIEAVVNKLGGIDAVDRFLRGDLAVSPSRASDLLRQVATVVVNGTKKFIAKDYLEAANIGWTNESFKHFFLDKVEKNVEAANLAVHRLQKASLDAPILDELGDRAEISLVRFFELLKKQARDQSGPLLTNGYANIAYIRDSEENLWAVNAYWFDVDRAWYVYADSVEGPLSWLAGRRVLSLAIPDA